MELKYFTLKPRGTTPYARASRAAMRTFAAEIEQDNLKLSAEVKQWVHEEERKLITEAKHEAQG